jgi:hypothetical protein
MEDILKNEITQIFEFLVASAGDTISESVTLGSRFESVTHVSIDSNNPKQPFFRGLTGIELNGKELFDKNYPAKYLMAAASVNPNEKF